MYNFPEQEPTEKNFVFILPNEIVAECLSNLSPIDASIVKQACKRFKFMIDDKYINKRIEKKISIKLFTHSLKACK